MSYLGVPPFGQTVRTTTELTATAAQTTFTPAGGYLPGYIDVFMNGVLLDSSDYTATNGSTVVLAAAAALDDEIKTIAYWPVSMVDTYRKSEVDSGFLPAVNPSYTGTLTGGTGVVNLGSGQVYKDASGNVGIGTSSPQVNLQIGNADNASRSIVVHTANNGDARLRFREGGTVGSGFNEYSFGMLGASNAMTWESQGLGEVARLDSSGNLLVGTTSFNYAANGVGFRSSDYSYFTTTSTTPLLLNRRGTTGTLVSMNYSDGGVGSISTNGSATAYNTSSDYRLKENIAPMTGALAKVAALKPVTYTWKASGETDEGFIAHELQEVCPSAVTGEKDAVNEDGSIKPQGIDTSFLVATLTAAIQELKAINDAQAQTIESLTARVAALEGQA